MKPEKRDYTVMAGSLFEDLVNASMDCDDQGRSGCVGVRDPE